MPLLYVKNLSAGFDSKLGYIPAVTGVSFGVERGRCVALVGESGCGKSVTAMSLLKLLDMSCAHIEADELTFNGRDILRLPANSMRQVRGNEISMIFQEPMTSFNPLMTVGAQVAESAALHLGYSRKAAKDAAIEMLHKVGIPEPEARYRNYPHQMSGGMRQRAMIAMAMVCGPKLLIADEPVTALDVTISAQILELMNSMRRDSNMAVLMITHSLGVVAETAEEMLAMYAGQIVEQGDTRAVFERPLHPYMLGLMNAIPSVDTEKGKGLYAIKGTVPSPMFFSKACRFAERCPYARELCRKQAPEYRLAEPEHYARCHFPPDEWVLSEQANPGCA